MWMEVDVRLSRVGLTEDEFDQLRTDLRGPARDVILPIIDDIVVPVTRKQV